MITVAGRRVRYEGAARSAMLDVSRMFDVASFVPDHELWLFPCPAKECKTRSRRIVGRLTVDHLFKDAA